MDEIIKYYSKNMTFKKLVLDKMCTNLKVINILILLMFIGSICLSIINQNGIKHLIVMIMFEIILILSTTISINLVLIENYNYKCQWSNALLIGHESIEKHRIAEMKVYLMNNGYNKPVQVEKIIKILSYKEKENKHTGALTKTIFIAGLIALIGNIIQRCFLKMPQGTILSSECLVQVFAILFIISGIVYFIESTICNGFNFLLSAESRKFASISKILDFIILELHTESNNIS